MADNLYKKMLSVSTEVRSVDKNLVVSTGRSSYKGVSDKDVILAVKRAEEKYGIISIPVKQEIVRSEYHDNNGRFLIEDVVKMTLRIIDVDNPTDFIEVEGYGRGMDSADKGFGKASTYARKYCLLNAYKIATGEDPDQWASPADPFAAKDLITAACPEWITWLRAKIDSGWSREQCETQVNKKNWTITDEAWQAASAR